MGLKNDRFFSFAPSSLDCSAYLGTYPDPLDGYLFDFEFFELELDDKTGRTLEELTSFTHYCIRQVLV